MGMPIPRPTPTPTLKAWDSACSDEDVDELSLVDAELLEVDAWFCPGEDSMEGLPEPLVTTGSEPAWVGAEVGTVPRIKVAGGILVHFEL